MYKLMSIDQSDATRIVELLNIDTGTIDKCFDDSALTNFKNFEFMKIDQEFDCKIALFGEIVEEKNDESVTCQILEPKVQVGEKILVRIKLGRDIYYIPRIQLEDCIKNQFIEYFYTRKDLIQVDNVIHGDLLTTLW